MDWPIPCWPNWSCPATALGLAAISEGLAILDSWRPDLILSRSI